MIVEPCQRPVVPALSLCALLLAGCSDGATGARPDAEAPEIRITSPAEESQAKDPEMVVQGTLTDSTGVSSMWYEVNGTAGDTTRFTAAPKQVGFGVTVTGLREGFNTVTVSARDVRGNVGSRSVTLTLRSDFTPPRVLVVSPGTDVTLPSDSVRISGRATDNVGVRSIRYSVDGGAERDLGITPDTAVSFAFTVSGLAVGGNTIRVTAYDAEGGSAAVQVMAARRPGPYTVTRLGTFGGSEAWALNEAGDVVGAGGQDLANSRLPFVWRRGVLTWLPTEGRPGVAQFINDTGMVVGTMSVPYPRSSIRVWTDGTARDLAVDSTGAGATGINDLGDVAGNVSNSSRQTAFLWRDGSVTYLGTGGHAGASRSTAAGINERGQIAGTLHFTDGGRSAFLWENGQFTLLYPRGTWSEARAVNEHGHVLVELQNRQFAVWEPGRTRAVEGITVARAMNDHGHVVGSIVGANFEARGMLWMGGKSFDLSSLLVDSSVTIIVASGINNRGQITAHVPGRTNGPMEAVLLTPVSP